jgi:hypothetical protein
MTIAEQIMLGTAQDTRNWNVLSQSLSQLGQQVGQTLAMNEYRKQAQTALPAMQAAYKSAFDKMGQGQYADGYMELLNTNLQYGATQNPFIAQIAQQANDTAKQFESAMWRQAQYGGRMGGGTQSPSGLPAMSGADIVRQRAGRSAIPQPPVTTGDAEAASKDIGNAVLLPDETPIDFDSPVDEVTASEAQPITGEGEELNPVQAATRDAALARNEKPPEERIAYSQQVLELNPPAKGYEEQTIPVEDFYGTNKIYVPKPGEEIDATYTITGTSGSAETRETLTEKTRLVGEDEYKETKKIVKDANDAMAYISKNRPVNTKKTFKQLILEGGGPEYFNITPNDGRDEDPTRFPSALVNTNTEEQYFLTEEEAKKIFPLLALPTLVESRGVRFGEGAKPVVKEAPAPAAGGSVAERVRAQYGKKEGDATAATQATPAPAAPARELTLAEQITATAPTPAPAAPTAPRKQPERRGAKAAQESTRLNREREGLRKALYEVTRRGEVRGLKKGLDPENATVKRGIERLKEIEKQLASL